MLVDDIIKIRIDVKSENQHALSLMLAKDGSIVRQGTANLPVATEIFEGKIESEVFNALIKRLDNQLFDYASVYDHPDKSGVPIIYSVAFQDAQGESLFFEFRFGSETKELGELLPYFDGYVSQAVQLTDNWYKERLKT